MTFCLSGNEATREQFPRRSRIRTGRTVPYTPDEVCRFAGSAVRLHPPAPPVQQEFDMHFCALPEPNSMRPTGRSDTARQYFQRLQDKYRLGEATLTINREATIPEIHQ